MNKHDEIDEIDLRILSVLSENAKMPYTEVAKRAFVTSGTVHFRMKKLEGSGIARTTLSLDYSKMGWAVTAFLGIFLEKSAYYNKVIRELKKIPEVVKVHYTTGNYNIFAKIHARDNKHLKDVLYDKIQLLEGVERTETFISLEESLNRHLQFG